MLIPEFEPDRRSTWEYTRQEILDPTLLVMRGPKDDRGLHDVRQAVLAHRNLIPLVDLRYFPEMRDGSLIRIDEPSPAVK